MDPTIGWYQPEQFGPAKDLWLHIWEAEKGLDILTLKRDNNGGIGCAVVGGGVGVGVNSSVGPTQAMATSKSGPDFISLDNNVNSDRTTMNHHRAQHNTCNNYYNPSRRKNDNRARTYGMNYNHDVLIGEHGGCPWRVPNKQYSKGVIGYV